MSTPDERNGPAMGNGAAAEQHQGQGNTVPDDFDPFADLDGTSATGYGQAQADYLAAGWPSVLPLPKGQKWPPPKGFTGKKYADVVPTAEQHKAWAEQYPDGNLALRLPPGVLGVDVDDYGDKHGAETIAQIEARAGVAFPDTWISSSRDDGVSGIRFYRVPEGLTWKNQPDVEVIHTGHRYAVVWPSIHPEGRAYRWHCQLPWDGSPRFPRPAELPELPDALVKELTEAPANDVDLDEAREWLTAGEPDADVLQALESYDGHRETARRLQVALLGLGKDGHTGTLAAMDTLKERYLVDHDDHDWSRMLAGAPGQVNVTPDLDDLAKKHGLTDDPSMAELLDQHARQAEEKAQEREQADPMKQAIEQEATRLYVRERGRRLYEGRIAGLLPDPVLTSLTDLLAEPDDAPAYRIDGLWPTGGNVILAAARKAGKTTMVGNLARSLVDGDAFLGMPGPVHVNGFDVTPVDGMVAVLDLELDRRMLRRWLGNQGIGKRDQVMAEALRGRAHLFDVLDDKRRGKWAALLEQYGVKVLLLDPLGALLDAYGRDENSNSDVGPVLQALDALKAEAGVQELLLAHHMGHQGERSRGASKLRGWPDAEWFLVRERAASGEEPPPDAARFFLAEGRDVMVPERQISYDPATRRLTVAGGNRVQHQATKNGPALLKIIEQTPGLSGREIIDAAMAQGIAKHATETALRKLARDGLVKVKPGPKRANLYHPLQAQDQGKGPDPFG
jgi:hypothetical protein